MYILLILLLAIGAFVALLSLREPVLRGKLPKWLRPFYLWIFPPTEFYMRTKLREVDLTKRERVEFEFAPKYPGEYEIGVIVDRKIEMPAKTYNLGFSGAILVYPVDRKSSSRNIGSNPLPWWDVNSNGFAFATFSVPSDIPLDHATRFVLRMHTETESCGRDYRRATSHTGKRPDNAVHRPHCG